MICSNYEQYEEIGNTLADVLRYGNGLENHFDLFPEPFRATFQTDFEDLQIATEGLSFSETLTYLENEGIIGLQYHQSIQELIDFIDTGSFSSSIDFVTKSAGIRDMIQTKKNDGTINCLDKKSIISFYSMMAGLVDYFEEVNTFNAGLNLNQVTTRDCTFSLMLL